MDCRSNLLENTEATLIGHKLTEFERERLMELTETSFRTMMDLEAATGLSADEVSLAIDHPRSRLRHLGTRLRG
jgi:predicted TPR repeat methyltransferase